MVHMPTFLNSELVVLLIEDDVQVRFLLRMMLERSGYQVVEASSSVLGTDLHRRIHDEIDVVLLDLGPSATTALSLLARLWSVDSEAKVISMTSGGPPKEMVERMPHVLKKPFKIHDLEETLQRCLSEQ